MLITGSVVYLLHSERPYVSQSGMKKKTVQHYIGWTNDLASRLAEHQSGCVRAARICRLWLENDIPFAVVKTWRGSWTKEKELKRKKRAWLLCPVCRKEKGVKLKRRKCNKESRIEK